MKSRTRRPYLFAGTLILLLAAFFRLWDLGTVPPGLLVDELHNAQLADAMRAGNVSVVYDEVTPGREGVYYALLVATSMLFGRGLILWRLPSVWLSLLGLCVTFSLVRRLLNGRVALLVMAYMAIAFWPVWMGRAVSNVAMMPLATASFGYMMTRAFRSSNPQEAGLWFTAAGVGLGAAQYIHVTAWGLGLVLLGFILYLGVSHPEVLRERWGNIVYSLLLAAIIFLPMVVYMVSHPGVRLPVPMAEQGDLLDVVPERALHTLGGLALRGDSSPNRNVPFRPILEPVSAVLFVVGVGVALSRAGRASLAMLPIWFILGLIPAALVPDAPNAEFMALLMPVVFVFPALALDEIGILLLRRRRVLGGWTGLVVALFVANALWTARDAFVRWPEGGDVRFNYQHDVASVARYLDVNTATTPVGLCVIPLPDTDDPFALRSDDLLGYFMHRHTLPIRKFDCRQTLVLAEGGREQVLVFLRSQYYEDVPGPLLAWLRFSEEESISGVPPGVVRRLEAEEQLGDLLSGAARSALAAWPPEASGGPGPASLPAEFVGNLRLESYQVRDGTLLPGELPELISYWRLTDSPPPPDVSLQVRLQSRPGVVAASEDWGADLDTLQSGDIVAQYNLLLTTEEEPLEPGDYRLAVGLVIPDTTVRLRALDGGRPRSDRLLLQNIEVVD